MRSCPHCQAPTEAGAHFCGNCGQLIHQPDSHAATLADPQQSRPHGASDAPPTGRLIGREIIGQYVIQRKLGEGGMGEVYFADQPSIGRAVAIKVLHPHVTRDPDTGKRFQLEAKAAARLQSPHIVSIFNYGDMGDGTLFMAMEYLAGRTLSEVIRAEAPLDPARAVRIAQQCCEALQEAHDAGIVHRDLKPSNIMLVQRGQDSDFVKVLDFGVAKLEGGDMTRDGALFGTPQYMSPEQLRTENIDGRSDLYALGAIVYEMLGGRPPFEAPTPVGYINMHLNEQPPPLHDRVPNLPNALTMAVMQALAKDRHARPQTAADFARSLSAAMTGHAPAPRPASAVSAAHATAQSAPQPYPHPGHHYPHAHAASHPAHSSTGMSPAIWVVLVVVILGVIGGGGTFAYSYLAAESSEADARLAALEAELEAQRLAELAAATESADQAVDPKPDDESTPESNPPPVVTPPDPDPTPIAEPTRPLGNLSPQTEKLMGMNIAELEKILDERLEASMMPPSARNQVRESYELQKRMAPSGEAADRQIKFALIQYIVAYEDESLQAKPGDRLPLSELEKTFMSMETKDQLDSDMRKMILEQALSNYDDYHNPEDIDFLKRVALAAMIRSLAKDPMIVDRPRN